MAADVDSSQVKCPEDSARGMHFIFNCLSMNVFISDSPCQALVEIPNIWFRMTPHATMWDIVSGKTRVFLLSQSDDLPEVYCWQQTDLVHVAFTRSLCLITLLAKWEAYYHDKWFLAVWQAFCKIRPFSKATVITAGRSKNLWDELRYSQSKGHKLWDTAGVTSAGEQFLGYCLGKTTNYVSSGL